VKQSAKPTTSDRTLAIAMALSLLLHALVFISWPQKAPEELFTAAAFPLELETGPAFVSNMEASAPDLSPKAPDTPGETRPLNRHALTKKYLARIRKKIEQNKFYPPGQKDSKMIGNAEIGFHINANGNFEHIRLLRSSGNPRLDDTALRAVSHISGTIKRPAPIKGVLIRTSVVIKYQYGL